MSDREKARALMERLDKEAKAGGYFLSTDEEMVLDLMDGLLVNQQRYGYLACPCRMADGIREEDLDLICPCDYRDPDLDEYGTCYCALYVSEEVVKGQKKIGSIPDRRPLLEERAEIKIKKNQAANNKSSAFAGASQPVWRCLVCGYLCARPQPPLKCPVCKADKDRFERFA
ncbi:MAG: ferredoxin:glutaredoxin reductase [Deltaproteobacteria bacterium]|nr:ferredoxin:glutaredoxin reductase [Deltaproteobacteria bacterium]